jgi:hypothetical protein
MGVRLHIKFLEHLAWSPKPQFQIWIRSDQWLLRYSYFAFLRSSSMEGRLHFKFSKHLAWVRSDQWLLRYSTFCPVNLSLVVRHTQ